MSRPAIAILAFSPVSQDARVLRQIDYLGKYYDLVIVGEGNAPRDLSTRPGMTWLRVDRKWRTVVAIARLPLLFLSRFSARFFSLWYWSSPANRSALDAIRRLAPPNLVAIHANDWNTLPLALRVASTDQSLRIVLDLHEYAPLEFEERPLWRLLYAPAVRALLLRERGHLAACVTVAESIADRYRAEFGLDPLVVLNTPETVAVADHPVGAGHIRMIHHGGADRGRQLELTIDVLDRCDSRFSLDFMLVGDPGYIAELRRLAKKAVGARISFRDPVPPDQILDAISKYDLGVFLLPPTSYSKAESLPNKLFDFVGAGLAVVVGPTPGMASFVRSHGIGLVTESFEPARVAEELRRLDTHDIEVMRARSREVRTQYSASTEMAKVVALYERLLA